MTKERRAAAAKGEMYYHGVPCRRCGGTMRYAASAGCVYCRRQAGRKPSSQDVLQTIGLRDNMGQVVSIVRRQINIGPVGNTHESLLAFEVFRQAALDVFDDRVAKSAKKFLLGDIPWLQLCGIDPDWVHRLFKDLGLWEMLVEREDLT